MIRAALDTSVALHLMLPQPYPGQEQEWEQAHELTRLRKQVEFYLPTATLGELLVAVEEGKRQAVSDHLLDQFPPLTYDPAAAIEAARLWAALHRTRRRIKLLPPRECIKTDLIIAACAVCGGMDLLCTTDEAFAAALRSVDPPLRIEPPARVVGQLAMPLPPPR